jgi:hypothetical protein
MKKLALCVIVGSLLIACLLFVRFDMPKAHAQSNPIPISYADGESFTLVDSLTTPAQTGVTWSSVIDYSGFGGIRVTVFDRAQLCPVVGHDCIGKNASLYNCNFRVDVFGADSIDQIDMAIDDSAPISSMSGFHRGIDIYDVPSTPKYVKIRVFVSPDDAYYGCRGSVSVRGVVQPSSSIRDYAGREYSHTVNTLDGAPADPSQVTLEADVAQRVTTTAGSSVRVHCTAEAYYSVGTTSVTATVADVPLPEKAVEKFKLGAKQTSISFISSTAGAICSVSKLGTP